MTPTQEPQHPTRTTATAIGISYRELYYWFRTMPGLGWDHYGSGQRATLSDEQVVRLDAVARARRAGLSLDLCRVVAAAPVDQPVVLGAGVEGVSIVVEFRAAAVVLTDA